MKRIGWWSEHPYSRRSVKTSVPHFADYPALEALMAKSDDLETQSLIPVLFLTGGRVSEVLKLKPKQFAIEGDFIKVKGMEVEKLRTRKKIGTKVNGRPLYEYKKEIGYRTFSWPRTEPLTQELLDFIWTRPEDDFLYKGLKTGEPRSDSWVYYRITSLDENWWPHRFRAERASQLASTYGFTDLMLMTWFGWTTDHEAKRYARLSTQNLEVWMRDRLKASNYPSLG